MGQSGDSGRYREMMKHHGIPVGIDHRIKAAADELRRFLPLDDPSRMTLLQVASDVLDAADRAEPEPPTRGQSVS